jgi:DNA-binding response OmpR family regulator
MRSILIALRDPNPFTTALEEAGYACEPFTTVHAVFERAVSKGAGLLILDSDLPDGSGIELCRHLRRIRPGLRVLFAVPESSAAVKLDAFEAGADDVVILPLDERELTLRVAAILRRGAGDAETFTCTIGPSVVNLGTGQGVRLNVPVALTGRELDLLRYLHRYRDRLVPRDELLREVWRYNTTGTRTVDVHMATLRKKLEANPRAPRHLMTVRRRGYVLKQG